MYYKQAYHYTVYIIVQILYMYISSLSLKTSAPTTESDYTVYLS